MIDKSKNVCYVIELYYTKDGKRKTIKFLSQHGINSKRFKGFANDYFTNVLPIKPHDRWYNGEVGTQATICKKSWSDITIRKQVLDGVTRKEMCH